MDPLRNLADPTYEPTDEELADLMRAAFSGIREAHEASLRDMRARIERLQREARAQSEPSPNAKLGP
jgi:hypothetical protein